jgi:hypothetical protein
MRKRQQQLAKEGNDAPLSVVVEHLREPTAASSIDDEMLRQSLGASTRSDLLRISFFLNKVESAQDLRPALQESYQGYCILKRVEAATCPALGHILEAVIDASAPLLNNYIHAQAIFSQEVCGQAFHVTGSYFCQQNGKTTCCAHDALASALMSLPSGQNYEQVRRTLDSGLAVQPGAPGPTLGQMVSALTSLNIPCRVHDLERGAAPEDYRGLVYATIESGFAAVMVFTTSRQRHAIAVVGHTLNSDTWFPEGEFGYGSSQSTSKYHPSYDWAPHWIVNDGNLGMYYCLESNRMRLSAPAGPTAPSSPAGSLEPLKVVAVIGIFDQPVDIVVKNAEEKVACLLGYITEVVAQAGQPNADNPQHRWLQRLVAACREPTSPGPILRTLLLTKQEYMKHLFAEPDWNNNTLSPDQRKTLTQLLEQTLPPHLWMTEFTLVNLFTANRRKLGEVVYSDAWSQSKEVIDEHLHLVRLPGMAWFPTLKRVESIAITAHTKLLRCLPTSQGQPEY